mgnify:FL=1
METAISVMSNGGSAALGDLLALLGVMAVPEIERDYSLP